MSHASSRGINVRINYWWIQLPFFFFFLVRELALLLNVDTILWVHFSLKGRKKTQTVCL